MDNTNEKSSDPSVVGVPVLMAISGLLAGVSIYLWMYQLHLFNVWISVVWGLYSLVQIVYLTRMRVYYPPRTFRFLLATSVVALGFAVLTGFLSIVKTKGFKTIKTVLISYAKLKQKDEKNR